MQRLLVVTLVCSLTSAVVWAAEFAEFPEFRYTSGLPGGGYGVTPDGQIGFQGAMQITIPVGYTPGWATAAVVPSVAAINGGIPNDWAGPDVNGSLAMGFGMFNEHALWFTDMGTGNGRSLESAYNLQLQVVREKANFPGVSVGVIDALDQRADNIANPFGNGARSFFVVATREAGTAKHPLYLTLGFGNGRFNDRPFGGVSYQAMRRLKVFAEYDGFNPNVGAGYDAWFKGEWHAVVSVGLVDLDRVNVSLALTKTHF